MNFLRDNPNIARATSVLLIGALGAVGCSSSEEATIVETEITPMTAVYEWPLVKVENRPSGGFELVEVVDDSNYICRPTMDGEIKCSWIYDDDYIGYKRQTIPLDSNSSQPLVLEGREFAGSLDTPPVMDSPRNTANTKYTAESFYDISVDFTTGDSDNIKSCNDNFDAEIHNQDSIRKALTGAVSYNDSWGNKSIQFKKDGDLLLEIDC